MGVAANVRTIPSVMAPRVLAIQIVKISNAARTVAVVRAGPVQGIIKNARITAFVRFRLPVLAVVPSSLLGRRVSAIRAALKPVIVATIPAFCARPVSPGNAALQGMWKIARGNVPKNHGSEMRIVMRNSTAPSSSLMRVIAVRRANRKTVLGLVITPPG